MFVPRRAVDPAQDHERSPMITTMANHQGARTWPITMDSGRCPKPTVDPLYYCALPWFLSSSPACPARSQFASQAVVSRDLRERCFKNIEKRCPVSSCLRLCCQQSHMHICCICARYATWAYSRYWSCTWYRVQRYCSTKESNRPIILEEHQRLSR